MPGRTLDQIILESLGLKEMTISRLLWQIEDLKAQVADRDVELAALKAGRPAEQDDQVPS